MDNAKVLAKANIVLFLLTNKVEAYHLKINGMLYNFQNILFEYLTILSLDAFYFLKEN